MKERRTARRRPRGSLDSDAIIAAAVELIEQEGLRSLSMAALARAIDVPVTSIYWHFRSRRDLIDALAERVTTDLHEALPPVGDRPWDEELITYFDAFRRELLKRPSFLELHLDRSRLLTGPAVRRRLHERTEYTLAQIMRAGASPEDAYRLFHVCTVYVRGFVILELAAAYQYHDGGLPHPGIPPDPQVFPILSQLNTLALTWDDADRVFRLGLDVLVAGMRTALPAKSAPPARPPAGARGMRRPRTR